MNLVERAKNIITAPQKEWETIKSESASVQDLFINYALILAAIGPIAGLIGYSVIGISYFGFSVTVPFGDSILWAVVQYIFSLVGVFILGLIIDALAPSFGSTKDLTASMKVAVYSYTAAWVGGIFNIYYPLSILAAIASLYTLFLLYWGLGKVKSVPKDKLAGYFIVAVVAAIVVYIIIGLIVGSITFLGELTSARIRY